MKFQTIQSALSHCFGEEHGKRIAIEHLEQKISCGQLAAASRSLADRLRAEGAAKNTHIGVLANNRSLVIAAAVAIFRAGGVFVPFDPAYPPQRLKTLAHTADISHIILEDSLSAAAWADEPTKIVPIGNDIFSTTTANASQPGIESYHINDPIYLYFTSGTTGQPKPIIGRNIGLMHFIDWEINAFGFEPGVRVSQLTSPCHDPYLRDVFTTLAAGGTICIPDDKNTLLSPFEFRQWINRSAVNIIHCTPTMFRNLCNGGLSATDFPQLRWVLLAGERLLAKDLKLWYETFGDRINLVNLYGPTETTLAKLSYRISPTDLEKTFIPIGKPIKDTAVHILDEQLQECNADEAGELYIHTPFRSLGYYKNESLNREAFVPDPYNREEGNVLYRTGDFVRLLPDENIVFIERRDRQVKLRGKRLELAEIENELLTNPEINSCMVHFFTNENHEEQGSLVAYYTGAKNFSKDELSSYLNERLPDYMLPQYYVQVQSFPMNVNGKVDVAGLPDPLNNIPNKTDASETGTITENQSNAAGEIEEKLLHIWKEILNKDEVGLQDIFMRIGGDSLGIMQLINRVHTEFEFELTLWQIFDDLTIEKLATYIKG